MCPANRWEHLSPRAIWSAAGLVDVAGAWRWTAFLAAVVVDREHPGAALVVDAGLVRRVLATLIPLGLTGTRRRAVRTIWEPTAC